jgi:hypothetical protein
MAAGEDQPELVVLEGLVVELERLGVVGFEPHGQLDDRSVESGAPAHRVDRLEAACGYEPGGGLRRNAVPRPLLDRGGERIVHRVLGEGEVAEHPDQGREHAARLSPVGPVDRFAGDLFWIFVHPGRRRDRFHRALQPRTPVPSFRWREYRYRSRCRATFPG